MEARRDRLGKAIADFDAATIETTHGFCLQVLYGLGTAGDVDRDVTLVEDVSDLWRRWSTTSTSAGSPASRTRCDFTAAEALEIARTCSTIPTPTIVPPLSRAAEDLPSIRRRFADAVRDEMDAASGRSRS